MKRSGHRTIFHIYLLFFLSLLVTVVLAGCFFFLMISVQTPDGKSVRSDWPKVFTEDFKDQIIFIDDIPQVKQSGLEQLQKHKVGIQIIDRLRKGGNLVIGSRSSPMKRIPVRSFCSLFLPENQRMEK